MDARSAEAIIKAFEGKGNEVPIDYEHQTVGGKFSRADGLSPAAGWVTATRPLLLPHLPGRREAAQEVCPQRTGRPDPRRYSSMEGFTSPALVHRGLTPANKSYFQNFDPVGKAWKREIAKKKSIGFPLRREERRGGDQWRNRKGYAARAREEKRGREQ